MININDNSAVVSALPAILGFLPEASIVVVLLDNVNGQLEIRNALRFDIDAHAAEQLTVVAAPAFRNIAAAILVAVCDDWIANHAAAQLNTVRDALAELNIDILVRLIVPTLDRPGQWTDIDRGTRGPITSFRDSVLSAQAALQGRPILANRGEIIAEFTPTTNPVPFVTAEPIDFLVDTFDTVAAIISGSAHAANYPDLATRIGILITNDVHLRDTMLLLCIDHAAAAARLWTHLANQLTGAARLETLTLAAACYYAASDAVRVGIALDTAALDANANHLDYPNLARLLLTALQAGMPPAEVREILAAIAVRDAL